MHQSLTIHAVTGLWVVSSLNKAAINIIKWSFQRRFSFLWDEHMSAGSYFSWIFKEIVQPFSRVVIPLDIHTSSVWVIWFPITCPALLLSLVGMHWYPTVALICIYPGMNVIDPFLHLFIIYMFSAKGLTTLAMVWIFVCSLKS